VRGLLPTLCRSTAFCRARDFSTDVTSDYEEDCVLIHSTLKPISLVVNMQEKENRFIYCDTKQQLSRYVGQQQAAEKCEFVQYKCLLCHIGCTLCRAAYLPGKLDVVLLFCNEFDDNWMIPG
jgi:hypothetical protein